MNFNSNQDLVDYLESQRVLDKKLREAFLAVNRAKFVPEELTPFVYQDIALSLFEGQTISQPTTVAFMLNLLKVRTGNRILDVGAGSGWVSAVLAYLCGNSGNVYAFEINEKMGKFGKANIERMRIGNIKYFIGNASGRWQEFAPYDRIYSGAAFRKIPDELKSLLTIGGILVAPTQDGNMKKIKRINENEFNEEIFPGFVFVPFINNN